MVVVDIELWPASVQALLVHYKPSFGSTDDVYRKYRCLSIEALKYACFRPVWSSLERSG